MRSCPCVVSFLSDPRTCKLTVKTESRFLGVWEWGTRNGYGNQGRLKKDPRKPFKMMGKFLIDCGERVWFTNKC